ncbi:MAG TPA: pilus assembly protein [Actinobacteria bacterium]|nr:pilus assembly protein [Actinomycetota bacterium]
MSRRSERGAALVEMALVVPVLLVILFGIIELGIAFRDRLTIGNATQTAARVGTAMGQQPDADLRILQSFEQSLSALPNSGVGIIKYVDIFEADAYGNPVGGCPGGNCNRYFYTYVDGTGPLCDWTPCPDPDAGYSGWNWAPNERSILVGDLDVMGVRMTYGHSWITGGFLPLPDVACDSGSPPTNCWADTALMRMEPQQFGVGSP